MRTEMSLSDFVATVISTDGFTVNYLDPLRLDRQDPAWYVWDANCHQLVASVSKQDKTVHVYCDGEMRIHVWEDGSMKYKDSQYSVIRYCDQLEENGIKNDLDLIAAEPRIDFLNNAWFDLYGDFVDGEWFNCVNHSLDDAIAQAKAVIDDSIAQNLPPLD